MARRWALATLLLISVSAIIAAQAVRASALSIDGHVSLTFNRNQATVSPARKCLAEGTLQPVYPAYMEDPRGDPQQADGV